LDILLKFKNNYECLEEYSTKHLEQFQAVKRVLIDVAL
jgi:hypothetical protein